MNTFDAQYLATGTEGRWFGPILATSPVGFAYDSRKIQPGQVFLALKTETNDGHKYLQNAAMKGASAAIVERYNSEVLIPQLVVEDSLRAFQSLAAFHRRNFKGKVIGITGSCGKTTSKDWLKVLLGEDVTHATDFNDNNTLGVPMTVLGIDLKKHKFAVIEAGMNMPGEMAQIAPIISPDIALITNVFRVHEAGVGGLEAIAREKAKLAEAVIKGGEVVLPAETLNLEAFKSHAAKATVLEESDSHFYSANCVRYLSRMTNISEWSLIVNSELGSNAYSIPAMTRGKRSNLAMLIYISKKLGINENVLQERLLRLVPSKYRGEWIEYSDQLYYADCYNANPSSMLDSFEFFNECTKNREDRLIVMGGMNELGCDAKAIHFKVAKSLKVKKSDRFIFIGPNAEDYREGVLSYPEAKIKSSQISIYLNKDDAREELNDFKGVIFLKSSKGGYYLWELLPNCEELLINS